MKKSSITRLLAIVLAGMMAFSLAACAPKQTPSTPPGEVTPSAAPSAEATKAPEPSAEPKEDFGDTGGLELPLVDQEVTLTWMVPSSVENLGELEIFQEITRRTGIKLDVQAVPPNSYAEKLNIIMGGGNLPDIINGISLADTNRYAAEGAFVAITDYLDELPNFKSLYVDNPENNYIMYSWSDDGGNVYKWPIYGLNRDVNHGFMYRADVFKELGIEPWTDNESFYNALKKIKEAHPDSYPFASKNGVNLFSRIAKYWDVADGRYPFYYNEGEKAWKFAGTDPQYKDMLDFMKKLYDEGLIDPEFLTDTQDAWSAKMTTDKAFVTWDWIGRLELFSSQVADANPNYDLRFGNPIGTTKKQFPLSKIENWGPSIKKGPNELAALKLLDYLSSPSGSELFTIGIEGKTFTWDSDGKPVYESLKDEPLIDIALLEQKFGMWVEGAYVRPDRRSVYYNFSEREQEAQDIGNRVGYNPADPDLKLTDDETAAYSDIYTAIAKELEVFASNYVTNASYGDAQWQEWVSKVDGMDVADALKLLNDAQARFDAEVK